MPKTVFVALSGGVDSSVSAAILKKQGYNVVGVHLRCFNVDGCAEKDAKDAERAAYQLEIPFYVFDLEKEYKEKVVEYMVRGYKSGTTPNPDVMCNKEIKFGLFFKKAMKLGADFVATGHYAQTKNGNLYEGLDNTKDQSYFLWTLTKKQLAKTLFPVGGLTKKQVRILAKKLGLHNATKKDSQGICFLGQVSIPEFLEQYIPNKKGDILNVEGQKIGTHKGAHYYTIGQRHGLGVGGFAVAHYVAAKNIRKNTITLAPEEHQLLYGKTATLEKVNLLEKKSKPPTPVFARIRYRQKIVEATLLKKSGHYQLVFKKPEKFIAIGQSAVFYKTAKLNGKKTRQLIGGGEIKVAV